MILPSENERLHIAVLCDRLGPYHLARLQAANRLANITAIEFSARDETYSWNILENVGINRVTLFKDRPISMQQSRVVARRMEETLNTIAPQTVVIAGWDAPASFAALRWSLATKTPTVLMSESQECDQRRRWWKEVVKRSVVKLHAAGFAGGKPQEEYLCSLGMARERIRVGCDVVDNKAFFVGSEMAKDKAVALRSRHALPEFYFLASSRFVEKKNLFALIHAYAYYVRGAGDNPWNLVLLGDGPLRSEIEVLRQRLGLSSLMLLPGFKQYEELPMYYGLASAFVLPSISEPWGLVVNEAMASGLPVIVSSRCGCVADLVHSGENGLVFDPEDTQALAGCLARMAADDCPRARMGQASRMAVSAFSPELFANNLLECARLAVRLPRPVAGFLDQFLLLCLLHRTWLHNLKPSSGRND